MTPMGTSVDHLRELVAAATPHPWPYITATFPGQPLPSDMADRQLMYLAPQLAELVADMAEAIEAEIERMTEAWESHSRANDYARIVQSDAHLNGLKFARDELLARLAALFPEDSA